MDMFDTHHPDDELLASLADGDDAGASAEVHAHVAACDRCRAVVAELEQLQAALAELPDVAPPRPLRLVPPVAEQRHRGSWLMRLRSLTAPVMTLAAVMIVVGAVGTAAPLASSGSAGVATDRLAGGAAVPAASAAQEQAAASPSGKAYAGAVNDAAATPTEAPEPVFGPVTSPAQTPEVGQLRLASNQGRGPTGFEWLLGAGVLLLAAAFTIRALGAQRSFGAGGP